MIVDEKPVAEWFLALDIQLDTGGRVLEILWIFCLFWGQVPRAGLVRGLVIHFIPRYVDLVE